MCPVHVVGVVAWVSRRREGVRGVEMRDAHERGRDTRHFDVELTLFITGYVCVNLHPALEYDGLLACFCNFCCGARGKQPQDINSANVWKRLAAQIKYITSKRSANMVLG